MARKGQGFAEFIDRLSEAAVDELRDVAVEVGRKLREQPPAVPGLLAIYVCASCRDPFRSNQMNLVAMIHPSQPFCMCNRCFQFFWRAGLLMKQHEERKRVGGGPAGPRTASAPQPPQKTAWEVVGVGMDATVEEIKRAYKAKAGKMHPDLFVGKSAAEQQAAKEEFHQLQTAYEVLMKIRKVAT